jgi:hypothetical protein
MKPSKLPKNKMASIRINAAVKEMLKKEGYSIQSIIDQFIDAKFDVSSKIKKLTK